MSVVVLGASHRISNFLLGIATLIINLTLKSVGLEVEVLHNHMLVQIPKSMKTTLSYFNLQPCTTIYAVCMTCNCTYKPVDTMGIVLRYPARCTNRPCPEDGPCDTILVCDQDTCHIPIKTFVYHHFHDCVAGLLTREDLELLMDKTCDDLQQNLSHNPSVIKDIWDAGFLRTFKGPCRQKAFIYHEGEECFLFPFHVDFFNMQSNLQCNAMTLCGIILCACLNLSLEMRYKPENMYLAGIIPELCEPSADQLNRFLDPLVSDLVNSWERGV